MPNLKVRELTLQNWVSRVSGIPGEIFGKLGDFLKSSLHVAALTKIKNIFIVCRGTQKYEIVGRGVGGQRLEILIFMGVLCVSLGLRDRN